MNIALNTVTLLISSSLLFYGLSLEAKYRAINLLGRIALIILCVLAFFILNGLFFYYANALPFTSFNPYSFASLYFNIGGLSLYQQTTLLLPVITIALSVPIIIVAPLFKSANHKIYGDAHFASTREIKKMGFLNGKGNIVVGSYKGRLLRYDLTNHMMVFAPSRSGKGVSLVIPNALEWQGSMLCTDNKYEIFEYTSGYRKAKGSEVYRFSPASKEFKSHRINPLDYIDRDNPSKRVSDIQLILDILITGAEGEHKMWAEEARSLSTGLLLWLMRSNRPFTLSELSAICKGQDLEEFLTLVLEDSIIADNLISIDHAAYIAIQNFLQKSTKEQSGVRSTLASMLRPWEDPFICAATSQSDFDFRDMRKRPITVYLSFGTGQISRLAPVINIIVQLFLNVMLDSIPGNDEPHKVLCLLDEINRFGRMDKFKDGFGDLAGYGVHLMPIIQNVGQFYSTYGNRDNSDIFFQNTDLKICFRQNAATDKEFVSNELGKKTIRLKTRSYASNRAGQNYNESFIERPLLTSQEVGRYSEKKQILITGNGVVQCNKIIYYKDLRFKHKILPPIEVPYHNPEFPIIDVKKANSLGEEDAETINRLKEEQQKTKVQAQAVGHAISESIKPLIEKATSSFKQNKEEVFVDKNTGEILDSLTSYFDEGDK